MNPQRLADLAAPQPGSGSMQCESMPDGTLVVLARKASGLGREAAEITGILEDVSSVASRQAESFSTLNAQSVEMSRANASIAQSARAAEGVARTARTAVSEALEETRVLSAAVGNMEQGVQEVTAALSGVSAAAAEIGAIAFQTRLLAFNASVEAVRAGEAGRGFAVVAQAIKDLAQQAHASSLQISTTVGALEQQIAELARHTEREGGTRASAAAGAVERAVSTFTTAFDEVDSGIEAISNLAEANLATCEAVTGVFGELSAEVGHAGANLNRASERAKDLLALSEEMIELSADCGVQTEDTPFIVAVARAAAEISALFEDGIERGEISLSALGDVNYVELPGTNPRQYRTRYLEFTDRYLPDIQEPLLELSDKVVFCAAVDRNGFLPTHNRKFSAHPRKDPVWNAANCRNRRIFDDRTGLGAARNRKPFLLQTYRRDMGGGHYALMKDLSSPIVVRGRHWGALRLAYRFD